MEKIRCVREEVQEDPDAKLEDPDPLKILEHPFQDEEDHEEDNGDAKLEDPDPLKILEHPFEDEEDHEEDNGGEEEDNVGGDTEEDSDDEGGDEKGDEDDGGGDTEEEDSDECWDDNGEPCLPYIGSSRSKPVVSCTAGSSYTEEEALDIVLSAFARNDELSEEWHEMVNNNRTPSPVRPLHALPKVTESCASGDECYHREFWTGITSETASNHPYFRPCSMMQVFSLRLSSPVDHHVNVYGSFSIRDCWEPLPNYLFKRSRDDPAMIPQGCSVLPLRSPSRGIYMLQYFLIDIDLWIKEEGEGSSDQELFCGYVELDFQKEAVGLKLTGRFHGDRYGLDMHYAYLWDSIETVIEVLAEAEHSSEVRFSALTSGLDDEIELYDGTFCGKGAIFRHFVAVKKQDELDVVLKTNDSLYKWTFQAGVGVVAAPEHPVPDFAQYFVMNVSFRTRGKAASAWQWSCICNDVHVIETCL